jgi:hypothetical protein
MRGAQARSWGVRDITLGRARRLADRTVRKPRSPSQWGVNLVGYFSSGLGLGEAARAMLVTLEAHDVPVVPVNTRPALGERCDPDLATVPAAAAPFTVNMFCVNGDGMRGFMRKQGRAFLDGRYSIGIWWWEVPPAPARWAEVSRSLDEIWVCSDHVLDAIAPIVDVPVMKIPQPVPLPIPDATPRRSLGFPDGFVFHSVFDYSSTFARKNPIGLVEAFRRAFAEDSGAHLFIRSINGKRDSRSRRLLESAAAGRPDIHIVDRYVSPGEKNAMLARCDCYVSLHRAEGFGLPLAEAMRLEKPVIATGWSGNLEFMTQANSYLVDYKLSRVGAGSWPYLPDAQWADPDLDDAARLMREVFADPRSAAARGRLAAREIGARHDPSEVGVTVAARLDDLRPA